VASLTVDKACIMSVRVSGYVSTLIQREQDDEASSVIPSMSKTTYQVSWTVQCMLQAFGHTDIGYPRLDIDHTLFSSAHTHI
jgi:hypothetical protein